jgi:hypothetical protein
LNDGKSIRGKYLADRINDTFVSVNQHLDPILPPPDPVFQQDNLRPEVPDEFYINEIDVYSKLSDISCSKSPGFDKIPNWILKSCALTLVLLVASILNASVQQSLVTTTWKKAEVIPIQKTGVLTDITK